MLSNWLQELCDALLKKDEGKITESLKTAGLALDDAKALLRLSALLHDIGHLPFSHAGEDILPDGKKHEDVTVAIILNSPIRDIIDKQFGGGFAEKVASLVDKKPVPPPLLLLRKLISDQFDADRMDYLLRDSHHCGVGYGNFDYPRLLETICVKDGEEGGLELAIEDGGVHILESMLLARYWMFTQVYFHKTRCIYDLYLSEYMASWAKGKFSSVLDMIQYDDDKIIQSLQNDYEKEDNPRQNELARRILERQHHKVVFHTSDHASGWDVRDTRKLYAKLESQFKGQIFILDPRSGSVHTFYEPNDPKSGDEFMVYKRKSNSPFKNITSASKLINLCLTPLKSYASMQMLNRVR